MNFLKTRNIIIFLIIGYSIWYFSNSFTQWIFGLNQKNAAISILQSEKIQEAYTYLEKYYYGFHERTPEQREDAMIDALTKSLWDKHTAYFNPKDAKDFSESLAGDFEWIWAVIKEHQKWIQITKIIPDSPASKNGLLSGDIILTVDKTETKWMTAEDAVNIIRWPKWTSVRLKILSGDVEKEITIKRGKVVVPSVYAEMLTGSKIWYIEVSLFGERTSEEFTQSVDNLIKSGATSLVIDARNNGWWFLDSAVDVLSIFVEEWKTTVTTRGIRVQENMEYKTKKWKIQNTHIPVIMLVNNMSASATEIMAWALQDYDRALIIWEKTYGKWSVQEPFILSDGSMMKITVAKWFTPKNRGIDEKWIDPDITISFIDEDYKKIYDRQLEAAKTIILKTNFTKESISDTKKNINDISKVLMDTKIINQ